MAVTASPAQASSPLTEEQRVLHFLGRFTFGPTPELVQEVRARGIKEWLDDRLEGGQLEGWQGESRALQRRLVEMGSLGLDNRQIMEDYVQPIPAGASAAERRRIRGLRNVPARELRDSVLLHAVYGANQVREVAADFFRNHFCVALDKGRVKFFATEYEREVIRERVFGSFRDMLAASAKHPAMLDYLDNAVSRRPPTKAELKAVEMKVRARTKSKEAGRRASDIAAQRGLNENYARELLELHTLGVDNHYTQADVENVALVLTGWTIENDEEQPLTFKFRAEMHSREDKKVLRKVIHHDRKNPQGEGEQLLALLAAHRGTADFVSWKLCRWLVRDDPPEDTVRRVAAAFRKSKGDLPSVYRAIVRDPGFFAPASYRAKFKRPFEFVVSALRATAADVKQVGPLLKALEAMNEDLYRCKDPTGYYDQAEAWLDPGAFAVRWKFARDLVEGRIDGTRIPGSFYAPLEQLEPRAWKNDIVRRVLPTGLGARTSAVLDRMVDEYLDSHARVYLMRLAPTIVGTVLGSPEFQQQ